MPVTLTKRQDEAWGFLEDRSHTEILYGGAAGGKRLYICPMEEQWKEVPGTNSAYFVSDHGRIMCTNWKGTGRREVMKPAKDAKGYLRTMLKYPDGYRTIKVHRIVAQAWIDNPHELPQVNHLNFDRCDNRVQNLEWCDGSRNTKHAVEAGRIKVPAYKEGVPGSRNGFAKLNEEQVIEIRQKFKPRVYTREMLAKEYGVSPHTIKDAILRRWRHV